MSLTLITITTITTSFLCMSQLLAASSVVEDLARIITTKPSGFNPVNTRFGFVVSVVVVVVVVVVVILVIIIVVVIIINN